ncbi:MAG: hemolysin family protein [Bacteroidota bacterium]
MDIALILSILATLLFSAFFSGIEIAFVSADRLHIELQGKKGVWPSKIVGKFVKNPSRFIGTTLVGNTLSLVLYGIFMAKMLDPLIRKGISIYWSELWVNDVTVLIAQTILSTLLVLFTAEFLPKSIFLINPNRMLNILALPMDLIYRLIYYPLVAPVVSFSKLVITKVLRLEYKEDQPVFGLTDLNDYINKTIMSSEETNVELDTKIFSNALEFKTIRVRECMIPRTDIVAVESTDTIEELRKAFVESGYSKIVVYKESIDDVIGYCHSLELFKKPKVIEDMITPIPIVPETMLANELMIQFIQEHKSLALVVDEFGGTSGIVSIEDIIEEIFGEIQDEHDDEDYTEQKINETTFLLSARHEIDYLNDKYDWNLPQGEYETLGGLILSVTEDLPETGDTVEMGPLTFSIQSMEDIRIETVKLFIDTDWEEED